MAQKQLNIMEAVKVLLKSGTVTIRHVPDQGNQFDMRLQFSGLDSEQVSDLQSLCDQFESVKIQDHQDGLDIDTIKVGESGFIDPWSTKTGTEPWWPFIEKASADPNMLNKHPTLSDVELLNIYYSSSSARERAKDKPMRLRSSISGSAAQARKAVTSSAIWLTVALGAPFPS